MSWGSDDVVDGAGGAAEGPAPVIGVDDLVAAAGELELRPVGEGADVRVPIPGTGAQVLVRVRPHDGAWRLDDAGASVDRMADDVHDDVDRALQHLRADDEPLRRDGDLLTCGPLDRAQVPAAVLRFAMVCGFVPSVTEAVARASRAPVAPLRPERSPTGTEIWDDEQGDWGSDSLRESARQFQEDALRRWAG